MSDLLLKRSWADIIFDKKNKIYGAYLLRQLYTKNVGLALIIAGSIFSGAIIGGYLYYKSLLDKEEEYVAPKTLVSTKIDTPPVEEQKDLTPPPPEPPKIETRSFPVYEPDLDDLADEINKNKTVDTSNAGLVNQEGPKNPTGPITFEEVKEEQPIQIEEQSYDLADIEENPEFPGGYAAMNEFFSKHLVYPRQAIKMGVSGNVQVMFSVESDGSLSNIKIARGVDELLDVEATRVVKMMPKWTTGKVGGKSVKVNKVTIPVRFQLGE